MLKGKDLIDPKDLSLEEYEEIFKLAEDMMENREKYSEIAKGKILATLFFEPSTRTRLSFESAMLRLGGGILGFSEASSSSASKGESLGDTIKVVSAYGDIIAMRHPKEGAAYLASKFSRSPVINAGDGGHQHPTQTLTDLLTIRRKLGRLKNLRIGFCGDLKFGRTVHSLIKALARYEGNSFVMISPKELDIPMYIKEELDRIGNVEYIETTSLEEYIGDLDILYMTRIQRERFLDKDEYERLKDSYILTVDKLENAKDDMIILHPLPRVNEVDYHVDEDKRAAYFDQAEYGIYARMALIALILGVASDNGARCEKSDKKVIVNKEVKCNNENCITNAETQPFKRIYKIEGEEFYRCGYCDKAIL